MTDKLKANVELCRRAYTANPTNKNLEAYRQAVKMLREAREFPRSMK